MLKIIHFLQENEEILALLKEKKISLIGVTPGEQVAILEAFDEKIYKDNGLWS